jgi:formylglycine-generating enzyme required for sulfatase activity
MPVNYVSFYDALRFANWLHNGQLSGAQDNTTTEDGAYAITAQSISDNSITRNAGATIFLTSEDEWYKAAYYDALSTSYFDYPAGSNAQTTCIAPTPVANTANCDASGGDTIDVDVDDPTGVGSFTGSASPHGTFDQGGNVWEWNEAIINNVNRGIRGGAFVVSASELAASNRNNIGPSTEIDSLGFRVAMIPEPATGILLMVGVLGLAYWRRLHT